ncbi:MAG: DNA-binding response regulator, LuxR family [Actinobacteria bacterium]|nr:DNA-binding response regulator, LuxR family [Actinomycetota bacterium]
MTLRVMIADDQGLVRAGFRMILEASGIEVVGEATDGEQAVRLARREHPDVVLMDIRMPNLDGIAATALLAGPGVTDPLRVVILTTYDLDEYVFDALAAGASGFLLKDVPPEDLIHGVQVVASGDGLLAPSVTRRLIAEFAQGRRTHKPVALPGPSLTPRELEVLELVARGQSNAEIAKALFVSDNTVKTHVTHLLDKLGLRDRVQAVIYAYETGIVEPGS